MKKIELPEDELIMFLCASSAATLKSIRDTIKDYSHLSASEVAEILDEMINGYLASDEHLIQPAKCFFSMKELKELEDK